MDIRSPSLLVAALADRWIHGASLSLTYTDLELLKLVEHYQRCWILRSLFVSSPLAFKCNCCYIRYVQGDGCNEAIEVRCGYPVQNNRSPVAANQYKILAHSKLKLLRPKILALLTFKWNKILPLFLEEIYIFIFLDIPKPLFHKFEFWHWPLQPLA